MVAITHTRPERTRPASSSGEFFAFVERDALAGEQLLELIDDEDQLGALVGQHAALEARRRSERSQRHAERQGRLGRRRRARCAARSATVTSDEMSSASPSRSLTRVVSRRANASKRSSPSPGVAGSEDDAPQGRPHRSRRRGRRLWDDAGLTRDDLPSRWAPEKPEGKAILPGRPWPAAAWPRRRCRPGQRRSARARIRRPRAHGKGAWLQILDPGVHGGRLPRRGAVR